MRAPTPLRTAPNAGPKLLGFVSGNRLSAVSRSPLCVQPQPAQTPATSSRRAAAFRVKVSNADGAVHGAAEGVQDGNGAHFGRAAR